MDRRSFLRSTGAIAGVGLAGCLGGSSPLVDRRVFEFGQYAESGGVRVTTTAVHVFEVVTYVDPDDGTSRTWNPDGDQGIAIAGYRVEKDAFEPVGWPDPADFHLRTELGAVQPRGTVPDGTSVHEIVSPTRARVPPPRLSGADGTIRRDWRNLYLIPSVDPGQLVTTWVAPERPIFWMRP